MNPAKVGLSVEELNPPRENARRKCNQGPQLGSKWNWPSLKTGHYKSLMLLQRPALKKSMAIIPLPSYIIFAPENRALDNFNFHTCESGSQPPPRINVNPRWINPRSSFIGHWWKMTEKNSSICYYYKSIQPPKKKWQLGLRFQRHWHVTNKPLQIFHPDFPSTVGLFSQAHTSLFFTRICWIRSGFCGFTTKILNLKTGSIDSDGAEKHGRYLCVFSLQMELECLKKTPERGHLGWKP